MVENTKSAAAIRTHGDAVARVETGLLNPHMQMEKTLVDYRPALRPSDLQLQGLIFLPPIRSRSESSRGKPATSACCFYFTNLLGCGSNGEKRPRDRWKRS